MDYELKTINKTKIANILSNITVALLFVITAYFIIIYSHKDSLSEIYFRVFNIINVVEILIFLSIAILSVITRYSILRSIMFVKSVMSFSVYAVIVIFILLVI